jgi:phosphoribosylformimino-5-aminoimidazole carboxamide ribotide isomerase
MRIIPSIDLFDGKVVRLVEGDFHRKTEYLPGPAAVARAYASAGFGMLHCVDLDGAKNGAVAGWDAIEAIVSVGALRIQVGGGIRTAAEISRLLKLGVDRVVIGSIILGNPGMVGEWIETLGPERFCAALDLNDGHIAVRGWQDVMPVPVSEVVPLLQKWGICRVISTDIRRDGTMVGPNVAL